MRPIRSWAVAAASMLAFYSLFYLIDAGISVWRLFVISDVLNAGDEADLEAAARPRVKEPVTSAIAP